MLKNGIHWMDVFLLPAIYKLCFFKLTFTKKAYLQKEERVLRVANLHLLRVVLWFICWEKRAGKTKEAERI